jgi:hypothetical protein
VITYFSNAFISTESFVRNIIKNER